MKRVLTWSARVAGGVLALMISLIAGLFGYPSMLPAARTVRLHGNIVVPGSFRLTRPFIDYLTIDGDTLYGAYTSQGVVFTVDVRSDRVATLVRGLGAVHGVAVDTNDGLGFVTDGSSSAVVAFDLRSGAKLRSIPVPKGPDAIIYDKRAGLIYVGSHEAGLATLIDPKTLARRGTISLHGAPEFAQADPQSGLIYQNLQDTNEVVIIDPLRAVIVSRIGLGDDFSPTGLDLDPARRRLFVAASDGSLAILDADSGRRIITMRTGYETDGVAYDPTGGRVYTADGVGTMTIVQQHDAARCSLVERAPTYFGCHALAISEQARRAYVACFGNVAVYDLLLAGEH